MSKFSRNINAIDRYLRGHRRDFMEPLGLKGIHARLFMLICRVPGLSQDQLSKRMGFDKSTIARQVELLEQLGYVNRNASEKDKRVLCVFPTEKMLEVWPRLDEDIQKWENALLQALTVEEKAQLDAILTKINEHMEEVEQR